MGGAIGVVFIVANIVSGAQAQFGFGEALVSIYLPNSTFPTYWLQFLLNAAALCVLMVVALGGEAWFSKANVVMFSILIGSIVYLFFVFLVAPPKMDVGFSGPQEAVLLTNLMPQLGPQPGPNFINVFGVLFSALTGIMTGPNLGVPMLASRSRSPLC
jgi:amino acid transporter